MVVLLSYIKVISIFLNVILRAFYILCFKGNDNCKENSVSNPCVKLLRSKVGKEIESLKEKTNLS